MFLEGLWRDVLYGARMLWQKPTYSAIAVLTLALGIGANTAIFSVVNAVLLEPLPFAEPDRVMALGQQTTQTAPLCRSSPSPTSPTFVIGAKPSIASRPITTST